MELHYEEYGNANAPLMLFLHGGGVSGWMWDKQIDYFSYYHCIVPDLPGHGKTPLVSSFTIKQSAEQLIELLEVTAKDKEIIVIGFSLGAQIAIQMISMRPNLIDFAIINSALVRPMPFARKMMNPLVGLTFPLIKNKSFSKLQAKTLYIEKDNFEKYYEECRHMRLDTLTQVLEQNMAFTIPSCFHETKTQILVTVGEKERAVMKKSAKDLVNANPQCTGIILPRTGHGVSLARPHFFHHSVDAWLKNGHIPKECCRIS